MRNLILKYLVYFMNPVRWLRALRRPADALRIISKVLTCPRLFMIAQNVEGLISVACGLALYDSVLKTDSVSLNIIEVGAFKGKSTCYLSLAAEETGKQVKSFELFTGLPEADSSLDPSFQAGQFAGSVSEYEHNVKTFGCRSKVDLIIGDARNTLLPAIGDKGFAVAFLDADVYVVMKEIVRQLLTKAEGGEIIIVHDINSPGVKKAIGEFRQVLFEQFISGFGVNEFAVFDVIYKDTVEKII